MSNLLKIYTDATRNEIEKNEVIESGSQATEVSKLSWLTHPGTKDYLESIGNEIQQLLEESINLASSYPTHTNHHKIIQNLVRVDTLRKQLTYARTN